MCIGAYHVVYERQHLFAAGPEVMEVAKLDGEYFASGVMIIFRFC